MPVCAHRHPVSRPVPRPGRSFLRVRFVTPSDSSSRLAPVDLFTHAVRAWLPILLGVLLGAGIATGITVWRPRTYTASAVIAAVPNPKLASAAGGLSALLGPMGASGVQPTPFLVAKLYTLRSALLDVAAREVAPGTLVIERVMQKPRAEIAPEKIESAMRDIVGTDVDKQTGLVTLSVEGRDTAVVRLVGTTLLDQMTRRYTEIAQSQAADQQEAVTKRVRTSAERLRAAEAALSDFEAANRLYAPHAEAAIIRSRLDRDLATAQGNYTQAVSDRDAATARAIDTPPPLVMVEPFPSTILPDRRLKLLAAILGAVLGGGLAFAAALSVARRRERAAGF